ncbi:hypothetical protein BOTBODRAFT_32610 [Botryobasidium botryosum FD-172 SS1]|uniref:L-serine ammonia-lyase n=1 Tax=Botryobasidium botryosum (strain FD-172 SS1) TaxID=930990 RepID=A0A067MG38_BOTB1|nr:hypothetical protein BOTBODRAFT_32610 [Botryobasidium botryosum FD-172 SS1]
MTTVSALPDFDAEPLWRKTPLIYSEGISQRLGCRCYLKLENLQFSHSFKYRGQSLFAQHALATHGPGAHLVIASGGNAGLALALAARHLGLRCTVFLPLGTQALVPLLERVSATVQLGGRDYDGACKAAKEFVGWTDKAVMAYAYEEPLLWQGIASMVQEISTQLPNGVKPDAIFCSVGGGGLIGGTMVGCSQVGWDDVPVIAMETHGTACFRHSVLLNEDDTYVLPEGVVESVDPTHGVKLATLPSITSRASSLGAISPSAGVVKIALERSGPVKCVSIADEVAMRAAAEFADEQKMLVELASSTTLASAYVPSLFEKILPAANGEESSKERAVVFIVCGGIRISLSDLAGYQGFLGEDGDGNEAAREVFIHGERWRME